MTTTVQRLALSGVAAIARSDVPVATIYLGPAGDDGPTDEEARTLGRRAVLARLDGRRAPAATVDAVRACLDALPEMSPATAVGVARRRRRVLPRDSRLARS
jgi:hypothetical protein